MHHRRHSTITQAQATLADAQARIEDAFIDGGETTQIRAEIEAAESEINRVKIEAIERARQPKPKSDTETRAEALAQGIADELNATMRAIVEGVQTPSAPVPDLSLAHGLIEAQDRHPEAHATLHEAEGRVEKLQTRLDELAAERQTIVDRRADGTFEATTRPPWQRWMRIFRDSTACSTAPRLPGREGENRERGR